MFEWPPGGWKLSQDPQISVGTHVWTSKDNPQLAIVSTQNPIAGDWSHVFIVDIGGGGALHTSTYERAMQIILLG